MKSKIILCILLGFAMVAFASAIVPYDKAKPPSLSLPIAYGYAMTALGSETNQFHCVDASIATTFSHDGEWFFTFYSTNSTPKWVTVEFNGKAHIEDIMLR